MAHSPYEGRAIKEPHSRRTNLQTTTRSSSNSQSSSLNGSLSSQLSQVRPNVAGDLDLIRPQSAVTPSTSLSNESSQERIDRPCLVESDVIPVDQDRNIYGPVTGGALNKDHTSAPKRMVNGQIKTSGSSLPTSPVESSQYGHSRNSSRTSRGSQIGELSNQLRTRLSYAMVKVQNGWQSHSISELESMASNQASPLSAVYDASRLHQQQFSTNCSADQSKAMQLSERTAAAPKYAYLLQHEDSDHGSRTIKVGAAYESFWRDHEAHGTSRPIEAPVLGPSLAPPADIVGRTPGRSDVTKRQPPPLRTNNLCANSSPVTPPTKRQSKIRTPSQQAEVEKDAVETLLFMSSPGGSGYHEPGAFARTPLQNQFAHQPDQTDGLGFSRLDEARSRGRQPELSYSQHLRSPAGKRPMSNAEMDKILDEIPDSSSSDDDELQDNRPSPQILGT